MNELLPWLLQRLYAGLQDSRSGNHLSLNDVSGTTMMTSWMEMVSALLNLCEINPLVIVGFPSQRVSNAGFDVFFHVNLNKQLNKPSSRRWFETPGRPLWRHCSDYTDFFKAFRQHWEFELPMYGTLFLLMLTLLLWTYFFQNMPVFCSHHGLLFQPICCIDIVFFELCLIHTVTYAKYVYEILHFSDLTETIYHSPNRISNWYVELKYNILILQNKFWILFNSGVYVVSSTMMASSNENIFRLTGPLWGEFTRDRWNPLTKASDAELWWFFFICAWTNGWANNRDADDLRRHRPHWNANFGMYM